MSRSHSHGRRQAWMCTQTKQTYQQLQQGVPLSQLGGYSNAMAIRAAAAYGYYDNEEDVVHAARVAMFTHKEKTAHDGNEFFARVAFRVIHAGLTPRQAIEAVAKESSRFIQTKVKQALDKVAEAVDPNKPLSQEEFADDLALTSMARLWDVGKTEPIKVGKASPTEGTLPGPCSTASHRRAHDAHSSRCVVCGAALHVHAVGVWLRHCQWTDRVACRLPATQLVVCAAGQARSISS